jgi:hypothetical protein
MNHPRRERPSGCAERPGHHRRQAEPREADLDIRSRLWREVADRRVDLLPDEARRVVALTLEVQTK